MFWVYLLQCEKTRRKHEGETGNEEDENRQQNMDEVRRERIAAVSSLQTESWKGG